jgi:hypothetical protein
LFFILPPPIRVQFGDPICIIEVDREDFGKLIDSKWSNGNNEALQ